MVGTSMIEAKVEIRESHREWLEQMAKTYRLPSTDKALRVLLEFAVQEGDADTIFKQVRCHHCG